MRGALPHSNHLVIACGGTGGHLFPGVAVGAEWVGRGGRVTLVVSEKEIDRVALQGENRFDVLRLPALGSGQGSALQVAASVWRSYSLCRSGFLESPPQAVLAMGGFTSVAPMLAGRNAGASLFLHDSNALPGRANRWLALLADEAFVGFEQARRHLRTSQVRCTGTPVRPCLVRPASPGPARINLGLDPLRPLLLVMGGSQGARGVNEAFLKALPVLVKAAPEVQYLHLSGQADYESVVSAYRSLSATAVVHPFFADMGLALGAADLVVSRAGASSLAEFAAVQVPPILIPLPTAADDHQTVNAQAFSNAGAGIWLPQRKAMDGQLADCILSLRQDPEKLAQMRKQLARSHIPDAARQIADRVEAHLWFSQPWGASDASRTPPGLFCVHP